MNVTMRDTETRHILSFERRLAHPIEKVWRAITEAEQLRAWFPAAVEGERAVGATLRFIFAGDAAPPSEGEIIAFEPPHLLEFTWSGEVLRWELSPEEHGCLLRFTHIFDDRAGAASFASGWHGCLDALDLLLAGQPTDGTGDGWRERHEHYFAQFGLARGAAPREGDGWIVRFAWQLTFPVDTAWAALTEFPGEPAAGMAAADAPPLRMTNGYVPAGRVCDREATVLEYAWLDDGEEAGRVRWQLTPGPGGARITLTQTVPDSLRAQLPRYLAAWQTHLEIFADHLKGIEHCPWPVERTEELRRGYVETAGGI